MSEDVAKLFRQIEARSKQIRSFIADYGASYRSSLMPFEVRRRQEIKVSKWLLC
jgi:hypothetical protein